MTHNSAPASADPDFVTMSRAMYALVEVRNFRVPEQQDGTAHFVRDAGTSRLEVWFSEKTQQFRITETREADLASGREELVETIGIYHGMEGLRHIDAVIKRELGGQRPSVAGAPPNPDTSHLG